MYRVYLRWVSWSWSSPTERWLKPPLWTGLSTDTDWLTCWSLCYWLLCPLQTPTLSLIVFEDIFPVLNMTSFPCCVQFIHEVQQRIEITIRTIFQIWGVYINICVSCAVNQVRQYMNVCMNICNVERFLRRPLRHVTSSVWVWSRTFVTYPCSLSTIKKRPKRKSNNSCNRTENEM